MRPVTLVRVQCFIDGFQVKQGRVRRDEVTFFVPGMMFRHDFAGTVVVGELSLTIASAFSNLNRGIVESRIPRSISGLRVRATSASFGYTIDVTNKDDLKYSRREARSFQPLNRRVVFPYNANRNIHLSHLHIPLCTPLHLRVLLVHFHHDPSLLQLRGQFLDVCQNTFVGMVLRFV
jgi:hypothetical protein